MVSGPVIIIEDDEDDKVLIEEVLNELEIPNKTLFFTRCTDAFAYLKTFDNQPFLIICDVNLPGISGLKFKRQIDADKDLRRKSIPFVFYSTSADKKYVDEAYIELTVQGYFQKENSYIETKNNIRKIFEYWKICKHPNAL